MNVSVFVEWIYITQEKTALAATHGGEASMQTWGHRLKGRSLTWFQFLTAKIYGNHAIVRTISDIAYKMGLTLSNSEFKPRIRESVKPSNNRLQYNSSLAYNLKTKQNKCN